MYRAHEWAQDVEHLAQGHLHGLGGLGLYAMAGDTDETHMRSAGDDRLNSDKRISIGMDLFRKPIKLFQSELDQRHQKTRQSEPWV